ncbi:conjugative transposon protein TraK [Niabella ginsengisoli]|uniref:Conjugative transposon protein TraK n=1 Tax=Niabella ginsengisoli TaxID=522298 RepID=A0ABS9SHT4_9BACT|nr:conjugative transposon protein TraK [Niabella ginsengisoli]MCH5597931.1 conjugative transposon protein TraK [Niabella ginsengisoli]
MMFEKMKNIDTAFRQVRLFTMLIVMGAIIISVFVIYRTTKVLAVNNGKVYVLVNGKLVEAIAQKRNIPVELRDHIRTFHTLFFTLSPDEKAIRQQITKALYLADGSAQRIYQNMKEAGFYNNLISGNISQTIEIEHIEVDTDKKPYRFRCTGKQYITRPTSTLIREIITAGTIRTGLVQSDNNTHGFLIERWEIVDNKDIKVSER